MFWRTLDHIAAVESLSTPQFISKLHSEVVNIHGEARNFSSLLRCTCLVYAEQNSAVPGPVATVWPTDDVESPPAVQ
jgi:predicted DNA-binding ribbon-helix-helix protein